MEVKQEEQELDKLLTSIRNGETELAEAKQTEEIVVEADPSDSPLDDFEVEDDPKEAPVAEEKSVIENPDDDPDDDDPDETELQKAEKKKRTRAERTAARRAYDARREAQMEALQLKIQDLAEQNRKIQEQHQQVSQYNQTQQHTQRQMEVEQLKAYQDQLKERRRQARQAFDHDTEDAIYDEMDKVKARLATYGDVQQAQTQVPQQYAQHTQQPPAQPQQFDPRVQQAAVKFNEFVSKSENSWVNKEFVNGVPQTPDARVAQDIYNELLSQSFDPRGEKFYSLAQEELKRRLPQRYVAGYGERKTSPTIQGGGTQVSSQASGKKMKITREEAEVLKEVKPKDPRKFLENYRSGAKSAKIGA